MLLGGDFTWVFGVGHLEPVVPPLPERAADVAMLSIVYWTHHWTHRHESTSQNEEIQIKIRPILLSGFVASAIGWLFDAQQERPAQIPGDRGPRVGGCGDNDSRTTQ